MKIIGGIVLAASAAVSAVPAMANDKDSAGAGAGADLSLGISGTARLRHEHVDQASLPASADALSLRLRLGAEVKAGLFSLLVEGEGTAAVVRDYNDTLPRNGVEPFPVIADPENLELNRAQIAVMKNGTGVTLGRQRINLDNQRFVGSIGWRQNEQTFDAVRGQARIGPIKLDATYAIAQRTVFGERSPNAHFDGDFVLLNAMVEARPVTVAAFSYLLDYDTRPAFSSATYGIMAQGSVPLGKVRLSAVASLATQGGHGSNPLDYSVTYAQVEIGAVLAGFSFRAGHEKLGSEGGLVAFQTPLATAHAFNGWADLFLTTPAAGLRDYYLKAGYTVPKPPVPGLNFQAAYHHFESDFGSLSYGREWNLSTGFRIGPVGMLAKYAHYDAKGFGANTRKLWVQAEYSF